MSLRQAQASHQVCPRCMASLSGGPLTCSQMIFRAVEAVREQTVQGLRARSIRMEGFGGPAQPFPTIAQCLNGEYANGATWPGTIHGRAA